MDAIFLATLFVEYATLQMKLEEVEHKIEKAVLEKGETVKIAGVTAKYYRPTRGTPDYKGIAENSLPANFDLSPFSTTSIRWKEVCQALRIPIPEGEPIPARVSISFSSGDLQETPQSP